MYHNIRIVLMNTSHPGNIGAVARAMKNMGLTQLCLVNPKNFPSDEAVRRASGADDLLAKVQVVNSFEEAVADTVMVFGASARGRKIPWPVMNPRHCAEKLWSLTHCQVVDGEVVANPDRKVAIVFGQEDRGLSNDELHQCNYHLNIPTNPVYSSLNLAMAVQVMVYEIRMKCLEALEKAGQETHLKPMVGANDDGWDEIPATKDEVEGVVRHFEEAAIQFGFFDPQKPKQLLPRFRRIVQRVQLDRNEVNILRGFFKSALKANRD